VSRGQEAEPAAPVIDIREVAWDHPDAVQLRAAQEAEIRARYRVDEPEPGVHPSAADMTSFFVAYVDSEPAGCGGLRAIDRTHGEIKRMYVVPERRGSGLAPAILRVLEDDATARGWTRLVLETGTGQPEAVRLYEREGYTPIPLFGDYVGEPTSLCFGKALKGDTSTRIRALDGLRGVAALIVLLHHMTLLNPVLAALALVPGTPPPAPGSWTWFGAMSPAFAGEAVLVFFVLSGVVVTLPALRPGFDWLAYFPRRFVRLVLPVLASLLIAFALALVTPQDPATAEGAWAAMFSIRDPDFYLVLSGAELLHGNTVLNGSLWTLAYELLFSLMLPLYVVVAVATRRWWIGVAMLSLLCISLSAHVSPNWTYLPVFLIGSLFAVSLPRLRALVARMTVPQRTVAGIACAALVVGLVTATLPGAAWLPAAPGLSELAGSLPMAVAGLLVFAALLWSPFQWLLELRPVRWLGRVSFSLYLIHAPIVLSTNAVLSGAPWYIRSLVAFPISLVAAELFTRFIEAPAHRWSKVVGRWSRALVDRAAVDRATPGRT